MIGLNFTPSDLKNSRIFIFLGPFGSGKTELAINFALWRREFKEEVSIADLDIISPYFRVRDHMDYLLENGIEVIAPVRELMYADLPIVPPNVVGYIANKNYELIMDIGGENDGAAVLGALKNYLDEFEYTSFMVLNTRRPFYRDIKSILDLIERLTSTARIRIDYLVNNTNIGRETTLDLIKEGERLLEKVSHESGVPIAFSVVPDFLDVGTFEDFKNKLFTIKRFFPNDQEV